MLQPHSPRGYFLLQITLRYLLPAASPRREFQGLHFGVFHAIPVLLSPEHQPRVDLWGKP